MHHDTAGVLSNVIHNKHVQTNQKNAWMFYDVLFPFHWQILTPPFNSTSADCSAISFFCQDGFNVVHVSPGVFVGDDLCDFGRDLHVMHVVSQMPDSNEHPESQVVAVQMTKIHHVFFRIISLAAKSPPIQGFCDSTRPGQECGCLATDLTQICKSYKQLRDPVIIYIY